MASNNTHEAIKTLVTGGMSREARDVIQRHAAAVQEQYAGISADETLSEKGRHWALASTYSVQMSQLQRELGGMASKVQRADQHDAELVFGTRGLRGDEASLIIARRDADDRVAEVTDSDELQTLLQKATRRNDEVMARAIVQRAVEIGDVKTAEAFRASRPEVEDAVGRLWNAERAQQDSLRFTIELANLLPGELTHMRPESIEALAVEAQPQEQRTSTRTPNIFRDADGFNLGAR